MGVHSSKPSFVIALSRGLGRASSSNLIETSAGAAVASVWVSDSLACSASVFASAAFTASSTGSACSVSGSAASVIASTASTVSEVSGASLASAALAVVSAAPDSVSSVPFFGFRFYRFCFCGFRLGGIGLLIVGDASVI
jgi:hypothetical protein